LQNIIIIPARYASTRLPGKLLLDLHGKTVIQRSFEQALLSKKANKVLIATDSQLIYDECLKFTNDVLLSTNIHDNGTSRIIEALDSIHLSFNNIVNVQGDEPFIEPEIIDEIFSYLEEGYQVVSAYHKIERAEAISPHNVKVITNHKSEAIYFSRSLIPYSEVENINTIYKKHIGIYGYKKQILLDLNTLEDKTNFDSEKLEQLLFIFNDITIKMVETDYTPIGIDVLEDYENAKKRLKS